MEPIQNTESWKFDRTTSGTSISIDTGLEVVDFRNNEAFLARRIHTRDLDVQMEGMQRITRAFVENPETILQELVDVAVALCDADSAGISIGKKNRTEDA